MDFEEIKERVKTDIPCMRYLTKAPKQDYICPYCGSGTGPNQSGAAHYYQDTNTFKCFVCGKKGDVIDTYLLYSGRDPSDNNNFRPAVIELGESIGLYLDDKPTKTARKAAESLEPVNNADTDDTAVKSEYEAVKGDIKDLFKDYCLKCAADIEKTDYLINLGIAPDVLKRYCVGYDTEAKEIVFPYNPYFTYKINRTADKANKRYIKPKTEDAGPEPLYNGAEIHDPRRPCFVCEGPVDCLSFATAGANAAAICGTGTKAILNECKKGRPPEPLILWLDFDDAGQDNQRKLAAALDAAGIDYITAEYDPHRYGLDHGDPNDLLQADREQFARDIQYNLERAKEAGEKAASLRELGPDMSELIKEIYTERYKPIPTGIQRLDEFLQGGLIRQTLILLGARPGAGKTILAQMIAESLAREGEDVFYICLEMSKTQLLARSLARIIYTRIDTESNISALDVLRGYGLTEPDRGKLYAAAKVYADEIGPSLQYNPITTPDVDGLIKALREAGEAAKEDGRPGPIVFIDYLHLLTSGQREDKSEIIKRAVTSLKQYAIDYNTIVFAIEAQNRTANESGEPTMEGGRDSSNLEYSGDLCLSLVTGDQEDKNAGDPNKVTLYVTKSRFTAFDIRRGLEFTKMGGQSYLAQEGEWTPAGPDAAKHFEPKTTTKPDGSVEIYI